MLSHLNCIWNRLSKFSKGHNASDRKAPCQQNNIACVWRRGLFIKPRRKRLDRLFVAKAATVGILAAACVTLAASRYRVGIDSQEKGCLDEKIFLIDTWNKSPARHDLFAFRARDLEPLIHNGRTLVKRAAGVPGDSILINERGVYVNGTAAASKPEAERFGLSEDAFYSQIDSAHGYFALGNNSDSLDSRYFGEIENEDIIGTVIAAW